MSIKECSECRDMYCRGIKGVCSKCGRIPYMKEVTKRTVMRYEFSPSIIESDKDDLIDILQEMRLTALCRTDTVFIEVTRTDGFPQFDGKNIMSNDIAAMMRAMMKEMASEYEDIGELSAAELKEWNDLNNESARLENESRKLKAKGDLFWANLEEKYGMMGQALKIDSDHLYIRREKTIQELQNEEIDDHDPTDI